jgi:hypothetical protein
MVSFQSGWLLTTIDIHQGFAMRLYRAPLNQRALKVFAGSGQQT